MQIFHAKKLIAVGDEVPFCKLLGLLEKMSKTPAQPKLRHLCVWI